MQNEAAPVSRWQMARSWPRASLFEMHPVEILRTSDWVSWLRPCPRCHWGAARSERSNGKRPWFLTPSMIDCRPCVAKTLKAQCKATSRTNGLCGGTVSWKMFGLQSQSESCKSRFDALKFLASPNFTGGLSFQREQHLYLVWSVGPILDDFSRCWSLLFLPCFLPHIWIKPNDYGSNAQIALVKHLCLFLLSFVHVLFQTIIVANASMNANLYHWQVGAIDRHIVWCLVASMLRYDVFLAPLFVQRRKLPQFQVGW